jgi:hypothetical protein
MTLVHLIRVPVGRLLGVILTGVQKGATVVLGLIAWIQVRQIDLGQTTWLALGKAAVDDVWFYLSLAATVFVAINPGAWLLRASRRGGRSEHRSNYLVLALKCIRKSVKPLAVHQFDKAREQLLMAAEIELTEALGLVDGAIKTNFLVAHGTDEVQVVARSRPGSPVDVVYKHDNDLAVTQAMKGNKTSAVGDVHQLGHPEKPYRSVVATAVADGTKAFGAITADSSEKGRFSGKEAVIDRVFRPYAALLLLTITKDSASYTCPERYV